MNISHVALSNLTPILYVTDFANTLSYFERCLDFRKLWDWDNPPTFGAVGHDGIEIFLCQRAQGAPGTWMEIFAEPRQLTVIRYPHARSLPPSGTRQDAAQ